MKKWVAGVALLAIGVWLVLREDATTSSTDLPPEIIDAEREDRLAPVEGEHAKPNEARSDEDETVREQVPPGAVASPDVTVVRGRTVDRDGRPVSGCWVNFHGWGGNRRRMDAHVSKHGAIDFVDPEGQTTGEDGRFEFSFVPPPPYQFSLDVGHDGCVTKTARWGELPRGETVDLGELVMRTGATVTGRVVDRHGVPQGDVRIYFKRDRRIDLSRGTVRDRDPRTARSAADGTFRVEGVAAAGTWNVRLRGRQKLSPDSLVIEEGQPSAFLEVVVVPQSEIESVSGIVVDQWGDPVSRVHVDYSTQGSGSRWIISTARDGTFRIERREGDAAGPFTISLSREGFERTTSEQKYEWGAKDIRLVLHADWGWKST